jgi:hypothetical protein
MTGTLRHLGLPSVMVMVLAASSPAERGDGVQATGPAETPAVSRRPKFNRPPPLMHSTGRRDPATLRVYQQG